MNKRLSLQLITLVLVVMTCTMCKPYTTSVPSTPQEALAELIAGNERYASNHPLHPNSDMNRALEVIRPSSFSRKPLSRTTQ